MAYGLDQGHEQVLYGLQDDFSIKKTPKKPLLFKVRPLDAAISNSLNNQTVYTEQV